MQAERRKKEFTHFLSRDAAYIQAQLKYRKMIQKGTVPFCTIFQNVIQLGTVPFCIILSQFALLTQVGVLEAQEIEHAVQADGVDALFSSCYNTRFCVEGYA